MEIAYIAGIFDGEGSVGIYANGRNNTWSVRASIVGTHRPMIEAVADGLGCGSFTYQKRQSTQSAKGLDYAVGVNCRQSWKWSSTSKQDIILVMPKLIPFLIEKREQAEIALAFAKGDISGEVASKKCKAAKRFSFPLEDFDEPTRRVFSAPGQSNPWAKLTDAIADQMRDEFDSGETVSELATKYNVSSDSVRRVLKNVTYITGKSCSRQVFVGRVFKTEGDVMNLKRDVLDGMSIPQAAKKYGCSYQNAYNIASGRSFKNYTA